MRKSVMFPLALCGAAMLTAPAAAATTLQISTANNRGWSIITPGATTPVAANSITRNPLWANVPWISSAASGRTSVAAGVYTYVYTLADAGQIPGLFSSLVGRAWTDNRLTGIFVNGVPVSGFAPTGNRAFQGPGRLVDLDLSSFGTIQSISFQSRNNGFTPAGFAFLAGAVPEPGTWMLMIIGLGAVGFSMRRRQKSSVRFQFA